MMVVHQMGEPMRLLAVLLVIVLAGCQTLAEKAAGDCVAVGIGPDHPDYQSCVASMLENRHRALDSLSNRMHQMQRDTQPQYYTVPGPRGPVRCTKWGDTVTCQ
jgi:hypothetical protein